MGGGPSNLPCIAGYENYRRLKTEVDWSAELLMQAVNKPSGKKTGKGLHVYFFFFFFGFIAFLSLFSGSLFEH